MMSETKPPGDPVAAPAAALVGGAAAPSPQAAAPATATAATDSTTKTILTEPVADKAQAAPATWPEDWRAQASGGDEKLTKRLERFADPAALAKSLAAAEAKIHSGQAKAAPPPADAKPEEVTAWRKENGIPETPAGYLEKLPDGVVIGDGDKELAELFVTDMHGANVSPEIAHKAIGSYYKVMELAEAKRSEADLKALRDFEDQVRPEWGAGYRGNINAIAGWLDTAGDEVKLALGQARAADGTPLMSHPGVMKFLLANVMEINPAATVVPGSGAAAGKGIEERIKAIEDTMGSREYAKNEKVQAEYRDLITAREKMKARAA